MQESETRNSEESGIHVQESKASRNKARKPFQEIRRRRSPAGGGIERSSHLSAQS